LPVTTPSTDNIQLLIVGGGPVGLMSAIEAYSNGAFVEVHEKRSDYTRNTWFDVESRWYNSLKTLREWGFDYQKLDRILHDGFEEAIALRTQNLER
jgi:2-polyprenyl-6-methoxyphenol hydroxylase-like FAD-dependent oxidoreductase